MPTEHNGHSSKLVYWILAAMGSAILGLSSLMASHQLAQSEEINRRLSRLEQQTAAISAQQNDRDRRLGAIEDRLQTLSENIRKLY